MNSVIPPPPHQDHLSQLPWLLQPRQHHELEPLVLVVGCIGMTALLLIRCYVGTVHCSSLWGGGFLVLLHGLCVVSLIMFLVLIIVTTLCDLCSCYVLSHGVYRSLIGRGSKRRLNRIKLLRCNRPRCNYSYVPYSRKYWRGTYSGGLAVLRAICHYFHLPNIYGMMSRYYMMSSTCGAPKASNFERMEPK